MTFLEDLEGDFDTSSADASVSAVETEVFPDDTSLVEEEKVSDSAAQSVSEDPAVKAAARARIKRWFFGL